MTAISHDPELAAGATVWRNEGAAPRMLDALVAEADLTSLHAHLVAAARNLIDARRLATFLAGRR